MGPITYAVQHSDDSDWALVLLFIISLPLLLTKLVLWLCERPRAIQRWRHRAVALRSC